MNDATSQRPLPHGWRRVQLRDLLTSLETGSRPKGGAAGITEGVPSLSAEHMTKLGTLKISPPRFVPREFFDHMSRGHIKRGDILIVKDGATTGKAAFVGDDLPFQEAVINEHVFLCRPNCDVVVPRYLFFWLWGSEGQSAIRLNYQGAAIGGISQRFTGSVFVPLPELSEQQRVVSILSEQMAAVERARGAAEARLEAAKALPAAYLRAVFDSSEARRWPRRRLGEVSTVVSKGTTPTTLGFGYISEGVPFLRAEDVIGGPVKASGVAFYISRETDAALSRSRLQPGDFLVTIAGTLGRVGFVPLDAPPMNCNQAVAFARVKLEVVSPQYLCHVTMLDRIMAPLLAKQAGGALQNLNLEQVRSLELPVPPLPEQQRTVSILSEQMAAVERARQALQEELDTINKLPAALLRRAFEGGL